ncbi:trypsin-like peptidase domain-containing protein [Coraliomargarita sp. SDUM461004]|uniref:Trypsin-like peptidase domain-containing protein n=1 Tax=Thalassobacterium sedimentorum TaxID=3041258 RepID=A0ABU1AH02_9BACT|nr:trypsin-like peptidase domain-containing protein [Coraliomargarita sp. SDUM461004]MDQ8193458.1 trypsin-like peptidase domain-containing protein [Coraliomargarita sp. SDUM461004]
MLQFLSILVLIVTSTAVAQAFHSLELKNGATVAGEVVVERADTVYIDLGFDLLPVPKAAIAQVQTGHAGNVGAGITAAPGLQGQTLYRVSEGRGDQTIRDWVDVLGEAVGLVQTPTGLGSGFVIHEAGYVVTNDHVIAGEHRISITIFKQGQHELTKQTYDNVRIVATSSELDLALLKIEVEPSESFVSVPLAAVDEGLREGQTVFAIGSPLGLDRTVSEGIISVANRVINGRLYLQTTTQINPGNSGGPLFNLQGEVVGVNNMKIAAVGAEGLGFSISSGTLKSFIDNRDAYAFDPRNPNAGFRYLSPPKVK